jgi:hypothetical protein
VSGAKNGHRLVSLDELLNLPLPFEDVNVPEYGDGMQLQLHAVTGLERAKLAASLKDSDITDPEQALSFQLKVIAASLGSPAEDISRLPAPVIDRLSTVALRLTGLSRETAADEALKATPSGDSG